MSRCFKQLKINEHSVVPKYIQLMELILEEIKNGKIAPGDGMPSLHENAIMLNLSKSTVEKAYNKLKNIGVLASYRGKGFYIADNHSLTGIIDSGQQANR